MPSVSRRETICLLGSGAAFSSLSGCLSADSPADVSASDVTVERGQKATISVQAENLRTIGFRQGWEPSIELVEYELNGVSPHPDEGLDSHPPYWIWNDIQTGVEITLPIAPPSDLEPGTYEWTVRVWRNEHANSQPNATATAAIEVT